jgi:hypothetical protein
MQSRNFKTPKNIQNEKTKKQINEHRKEFNKHQSKKNDTIKTGIYELKMATQNKRGVEQGYGKSQKKTIKQKS